MNLISVIPSIIIIILACWGHIYINSKKNKGIDQLMTRKRWIEMIPSAISTLGVLGTFFGIAYGLYFFNSSDLTRSIPDLL